MSGLVYRNLFHRLGRGRALLLASASVAIAFPAQAQTNPADQPAPASPVIEGATDGAAQVDSTTTSDAQAAPADDEEVVITGIRATQRNSLQTKRSADVIVDALVSEEIGALPDQSVGETLERIVGVTADRFKGSASEISVRGLGPFLGFSTLNGREVTSGSGDRAVSFQQFPSELVNGVLVYKSQSADLVEGGTSGIVDLRTLRPLEYGKRRIQADLRAVYEEYDDKIDGRDGLGYRGSISYTDQFKLGDGELGISIGYSRADESAPEDFYTESSTVRPCNGNTASGSNCSYNALSGNPVYYVANSYLWRQMNNKLTRDAVMGTIQFKPRPELNINLDGQYSKRSWVENRSDLVIAEGLRGVTPIEVANNGALLAFSGNSRFESQTRIRERDEDYIGGGLSIEWKDEKKFLGLDVSYSKTKREQVDRSTRLRTSATNTFENGRFTSGRIPYILDDRSGEPQLTIPNLVGGTPFDLNNHAIFDSAAYARRDSETRDDKIFAIRGDSEFFLDRGFLRSVKAGLRYSDHERVADLDNLNRLETISATLTAAGNANCRIGFRDDSFMSDGSGNVTSWATFDPLCLYSTFAGTNDAGPAADPRSTSDIDVTEKILAGYVMATFGEDGNRWAGNVGVRVVKTWVTANGYRTAFDVVNNAGAISLVPTGEFDTVTLKNDFVDILPSLNVKYLASDDFLIRGALYRAISRPNIEDMRAGRDFVIDNTSATTVEDAIAGVSGGNPRLRPLASWNADLSFEYYPSPDNALTLALFYKKLKAGIVPADASALSETFIIDGEPVTVPVAQQTNDKKGRDLWGFEATVNHAMTYLPGFLDGLGVIVGYSYADTNFEYPDPSAVDPNNPLRNFTDPAAIIGLSKHTLSATGYYEKGPFSLRVLYKYRSRYLKPFELAANRYAQAAGNLDASVTYKLTKNVQLRADVLNITNTPQILERPVPGSVSEVSYYGRKVYAGVKVRF